MSNEESLGGFPVKQIIPHLIQLMQREDNVLLMETSCRAIVNLLEALPRATSYLLDTIPVLISKVPS